MTSPVDSTPRPLGGGIVYWTTHNTIPAGPQNARYPPQPSPKRHRWANLRTRFNSSRSEISSPVFTPVDPLAFVAPRPAPPPPRRRNSSPPANRQEFSAQAQTERAPRPDYRRGQTEAITAHNLRTLPTARSNSVWTGSEGQQFSIPRRPVPYVSQPLRPPTPSPPSPSRPFSPVLLVSPVSPVSSVSLEHWNAVHDDRPISPLEPSEQTSNPIPETSSETSSDETVSSRYSYVPDNVDFSMFDTSAFGSNFGIITAVPVIITRARPNLRRDPPFRSADADTRTATAVSVTRARPAMIDIPPRRSRPSPSSPSTARPPSSPLQQTLNAPPSVPRLPLNPRRISPPAVLREIPRHRPLITLNTDTHHSRSAAFGGTSTPRGASGSSLCSDANELSELLDKYL